jgi:hypothetical protein
MSILRVLLALMLCVAPITLNAEVPDWLFRPVAIVELRSYGEQPQDMIELLVPFLANLGFTATITSAGIRDSGINRAMLRYSDSDVVGMRGASNCVVLEYFVTRPMRPLHGGPSSKERAETFTAALTLFLRELPTPRLSMRNLDWGAAFCAHAP